MPIYGPNGNVVDEIEDGEPGDSPNKQDESSRFNAERLYYSLRSFDLASEVGPKIAEVLKWVFRLLIFFVGDF